MGIFAIYLYFTSPDDLNLQDYVTKSVIKTVIDEQNLSPKQIQLLEDGDYEELVEDYEENITDEQIDCAVNAVGEKRANELLVTQDPSPGELLKLSKCL